MRSFLISRSMTAKRVENTTKTSSQYLVVALAVASLVMLVLGSSLPAEAQWTIESVAWGHHVGDIAVLSDSTIHIGYQRDNVGSDNWEELRWSIKDGGVWTDVFVSSSTNTHDYVGMDFAIDDLKRPRFSVIHRGPDDDRTYLVVRTWTGSSWQFQSLNDPRANFGSGTSVGITPENRTQACYLGHSEGFILYTENESGTWSKRTGAGVSGSANELLVGQLGMTHMLLYDGSRVYYVHWDGSQFETQQLESTSGYSGALALYLDSLGGLHAAFGGGSYSEDLIYWYKESEVSGWTREVVHERAGEYNRVMSVDLVCDSEGWPHVVFSRYSGGLHYAYSDYAGWHIEEAQEGSTTSLALAIDSGNRLHVAFQSNGIKYATRDLPEMQDGPEYTIEYVVAHWVSGAVDPNDACEINLDQILQAITWWASAAEVPETGGGVIDLDKILDLIDKWAAATCIDDPYNPMRVSHPQSSTVPMGDGAAVSVSRAITPSIADPGDTIRVEVAVEANQDIFGLGLDEALVGLPADWSPWTVAVVDNDGASYNAAEKQWLWLSLNEGDTKTLIYDITIPVDADTGLYEITGTAQSASPKLNAAIAGDRTILVGEPGDATGDGVVDICDIRLCYQIATGVIAGTAFERAMCDVDGDGDIDLEDVGRLY